MTKELEPCPFCGGEAQLIHPSNADHFCYVHSTVRCKKAGCRGYEFELWRGNDEEAITAWNTRYKRTCKMEPNPDYDLVTCSNCGYEEEKLILIPIEASASFDGKFCPNCGAEVIE